MSLRAIADTRRGELPDLDQFLSTWIAAHTDGLWAAQVEPLGQRDCACVHDLKAQGRIGDQQLSHPPVVMRNGLDDPQLIGGDRGTELGRQLRRPRRCGSASRWQISVTARDGTTNRDQFSCKNAVQRTWSRSAALNAATSGPMSHEVMLTRPRQVLARCPRLPSAA